MTAENDPLFWFVAAALDGVIDFVVTGIQFYGWMFRCMTGIGVRYDD